MTTPTDTPDTLQAALAEQSIELPEKQIELLERYCSLLWEWNAKINLTRHTDYHKFVARDLVDCRAFEQFLERDERVLDVGTGGGVPGVPLAILRDDLQVTLSESIGKKARAVADIVERLGIDVPVHHGRAEGLLAERKFNTLVVRAVGPIRKLLDWFAPHWDSFDRLLILAGPSWVEQRGEARHRGLLKRFALRRRLVYPMPDTGVESTLLEIRPR